jgi:hypothetical protein
MGFLTSKINSIAQRHQDAITQSPSEIRADKLKELNTELIAARSTYESAPFNLKTAEKNYYTLKDGPIQYEKNQLETYKKEAQQFKNELLIRHKNNIDNTFQSLSYYNSQRTYSKNINLVKLTVLKKILDQLKKIKRENVDKSTNNRKTYYVLQEQESVTFWLQFVNHCILSFIIVFIVYSVKEQHITTYTYLFTIAGLILVFYLEPLINLIRAIPLSFNVYTAWGEDTDNPTSTFYIVLCISIVLFFVIYKKNADIDNYFK